MPVGLAGAFLVVGISAGDKQPETPLLEFLITGMIPGWLLGVAALGLIRLFRVAAWSYPVVGLFVGPFIAAILLGGKQDKWGEVLVVSAILGAFCGLVEWGRVSRVRAGDR